MGFDPRSWASSPRQPRAVTSNVEALLAENDALRREVQQLRRRLEQLEWQSRSRAWTEASQRWQPREAAPPAARITAERVRRWGAALAEQVGWSELRAGREGQGLVGLLEELQRRSFNPELTLAQRLDRLAPGLGQELQEALKGPQTKQRLAVQAAFAVYGVSALEWLEDDPLRVVAELRQRLKRQERQGPAAGSRRGPGRRTSSDRRSTDRDPGEQQQQQERQQQQRQQRRRSAPPGADARRQEAYSVLGLDWGASREAIKQAHRRLAKQHHPDMGGRAEDFHRVNAAYQLLVA